MVQSWENIPNLYSVYKLFFEYRLILKKQENDQMKSSNDFKSDELKVKVENSITSLFTYLFSDTALKGKDLINNIQS